MNGSKRVIFYNEDIGNNQLRLRVRKPINDNREWFVYDEKSKTIRLASNKAMVMSNQQGMGIKKGIALVLAPYKSDLQTIVWDKGNARLFNGRIHNRCVDIWQGKNEENQALTYWDCHDGKNQKWSIKYMATVPTNTGFKHGQVFRIASRMKGNRILTGHNDIGNNQIAVVLKMPSHSKRDLFFFDQNIGAVRWSSNEDLILSIENGPAA